MLSLKKLHTNSYLDLVEISMQLNLSAKNCKNFFPVSSLKEDWESGSVCYSGQATMLRLGTNLVTSAIPSAVFPNLTTWDGEGLLPPAHRRITFGRYTQQPRIAKEYKTAHTPPAKQPQFKTDQCASQTCGQYKDNNSTGFNLSLLPFFNLKLGYMLKNTRWTKIF